MSKMKRGWFVCVLAVLAVLSMVFAACGGGNTFTFKFDMQGGPEVSAETVEAGTEFTLPVPTWEGYEFEGWYLNSDYSGTPITMQQADADYTFYAKWEKLYLVTLDVAGGMLSTSSFYLKAGENIADAAAQYVPTKENFQFGTWRRGTVTLGANERMPEENVTLTARYKVGYTVEVYEQKLLEGEARDEYVQVESVKGYEYADGTEFTPDVQKEGFDLVKHTGEVRSKVLSETNPSENVFKLYFNRIEYTLVFFENDGTDAANRIERGYYGEEFKLPTNYKREGYLLTGWSESSDGENLYTVDTIGENVHNGTSGIEPSKYTIEKDAVLYAVWMKGYTDIFGGRDYIYVLGDKVFLERAGVYFLGSKKGDYYLFNNADGETLLTAYIYEDRMFSYSNESRASYSATLIDSNAKPEGSDEDLENGYYDYFVRSTTIYFDAYNGIRYAVKTDGGVTVVSEGAYTVDEYGYFHTAFTAGDMVGRDFVFLTGTATDRDGKTKNAFRIRNEEEYGFGVLPCFAFTGKSVQDTGNYQVSFDGFGNAALNYNGTVVTLPYYYDSTEGMFGLYNGQDTFLVGKLVKVGRVQGYAIYNSNQDHTFKEYGNESNSLVLDGACSGVYYKNGVTLNGYYLLAQGQVESNIVTFVSGNDVYQFAVWGLKNSDDSVSYYFEELGSNYTEIYYYTETGALSLLMLVIDGEDTFTVYVADSKRQSYVAVARGTFVQDSTDETKFLATVTEHPDKETELYEVVDYDLRELSAFIYSLAYMTASDGNSIVVSYWWSYTLNGEDPIGFDKQYTAREGSKGTLTVVNGFAFYNVDGKSYWGTIRTNDLCAIFSGVLNNSLAYFYFDLHEDGTFELLNPELLGYAYLRDGSGETMLNDYIVLDGKGGAVYTIVTPGENGEEDVKDEKRGTAVALGTTEFNLPIYRFTEEGGSLSFNFILFADGTYLYYAVENSAFSGTYTSEAGEKIFLDGYTFHACYTLVDGSELMGLYSIEDAEGGLISFHMSLDGETMVVVYLDLREGNTFTVRKNEYGSYIAVDNGAQTGEIYSLDGYGNLEVLAYDEELQDFKSAATSTYTINENGTITLNYKRDNKESAVVVGVGFIVIGDYVYNAAFVYYAETVSTYINEADWSVLVLDGYGNAVRYSATGSTERGAYVILTEDLLYYVNTAGTFARVYNYDAAEGKIVMPDLQETGYFTEDLQSLLFTRYGFVVHNNSTICYYTVVGGNVKLYYARKEGANKYGFVEEDFGTFASEITFETAKYYRNTGLAISFKRSGDMNEYPIPFSQGKKAPIELLTFTPLGKDNYATTGSVLIDSVQHNATIVCENGEYFVRFATNGGGYFEYMITLTYHGEDASSYVVRGMDHVTPLYSHAYIQLYMLIYQFFGPQVAQSIPNTWGMLFFCVAYNVEGVATNELYVKGVFGESSKFFDANGNLIAQIPRIPCEVAQRDEEGSVVMYVAEFYNEIDGNYYSLYFQRAAISQLDVVTYYVNAFTRTQTIPASEQGDVQVVAERLIASDSQNAVVGTLLSLGLIQNDEEVNVTGSIFYDDCTALLFVHTDSSSTHYIITLVVDKDTNAYVSATVEIKTAALYFMDDGKSYVEIYEDEDEVAFFVTFSKLTYKFTFIEETEKIGDNSYIVTTKDGSKYSIVIDEDGVASVEAVSE